MEKYWNIGFGQNIPEEEVYKRAKAIFEVEAPELMGLFLPIWRSSTGRDWPTGNALV